MRVGGAATAFFEPASLSELTDFIRYQRDRNRSWRVLGGGTNVVVGAARLKVPVIHLARLQSVRYDGHWVEAGAGLKLQRLVHWTSHRSLAGLQGLAGIPGTVGGAIAMNAGGSLGSFCDHLDTVTVVTRDGEVEERGRDEIRPGYRTTDLDGAIVVGCRLRLDPTSRSDLVQLARDYFLRKAAVQPVDQKSAGCIFRNPRDGSAGALIEAVGLKGARRGHATVSARHANFIVHNGEASATDILGLIDQVRRTVLSQRGVHLALEVKIWPTDEDRLERGKGSF